MYTFKRNTMNTETKFKQVLESVLINKERDNVELVGDPILDNFLKNEAEAEEIFSTDAKELTYFKLDPECVVVKYLADICSDMTNKFKDKAYKVYGKRYGTHAPYFNIRTTLLLNEAMYKDHTQYNRIHNLCKDARTLDFFIGDMLFYMDCYRYVHKWCLEGGKHPEGYDSINSNFLSSSGITDWVPVPTANPTRPISEWSLAKTFKAIRNISIPYALFSKTKKVPRENIIEYIGLLYHHVCMTICYDQPDHIIRDTIKPTWARELNSSPQEAGKEGTQESGSMARYEADIRKTVREHVRREKRIAQREFENEKITSGKRRANDSVSNEPVIDTESKDDVMERINREIERIGHLKLESESNEEIKALAEDVYQRKIIEEKERQQEELDNLMHSISAKAKTAVETVIAGYTTKHWISDIRGITDTMMCMKDALMHLEFTHGVTDVDGSWDTITTRKNIQRAIFDAILTAQEDTVLFKMRTWISECMVSVSERFVFIQDTGNQKNMLTDIRIYNRMEPMVYRNETPLSLEERAEQEEVSLDWFKRVKDAVKPSEDNKWFNYACAFAFDYFITQMFVGCCTNSLVWDWDYYFRKKTSKVHVLNKHPEAPCITHLLGGWGLAYKGKIKWYAYSLDAIAAWVHVIMKDNNGIAMDRIGDTGYNISSIFN